MLPVPTLQVVVLDTGPLSLATSPQARPDALACRQWIRMLTARDVRVVVPEIANYEARRELVRAGKTASLANLDALAGVLSYLPLTTEVMREAARLWAEARINRRATADPHALDGDVILAAQVLSLGLLPGEVVVATTNAGHLAQFVTAKAWQEID